MNETSWGIRALGTFVLGYPIVMSFVWVVGGLYYFLRREWRQAPIERPPVLDVYPPATALVPCHNEGTRVKETIRALLEQRYPNLEIIAIDDGSTDETGATLDALAARHPRLRVIHLASNQGKAAALKMGALAAGSEYLICIDGDALLDEYATNWLVYHLVSGSRVGAVTGNPRIRNRDSLLGKLQVGEFSSIIGMIKRSQRTYGRLFTVSGSWSPSAGPRCTGSATGPTPSSRRTSTSPGDSRWTTGTFATNPGPCAPSWRRTPFGASGGNG